MIHLIKKYRVIILIMLLICINFLYIILKDTPVINDKESHHQLTWADYAPMSTALPRNEGQVKPNKELVKEVPVFVCGAVKNPGVYYVQKDTILDEIIKSAGGFTESADVWVLNLAEKIKGNEKIYIPKLGEKIDKPLISYENSKEEKNVTDTPVVNINTASQEELKTLPGIGNTRASEIMAYREMNGGFKTIEEIKNVSGIGDSTYEKLKQLIAIE